MRIAPRLRRDSRADNEADVALTPAVTLTGGIGHNLPQEAPGDFTRAIVDVLEF
jgi:hypothetical protein